MTNVQDVLTVMESIAPPELKEDWDNVGLLCGDRGQEALGVLCALDVTREVLREAARKDANIVIAHHPVIFTSVGRVTEDDETGRILREAVVRGISIICMHTNLDCAWGGVNDALAAARGLSKVENMDAGENRMLGRVGVLPQKYFPEEFAAYVKACLKAGGVRFCDGGRPISRVAVGGGACGKLMDAAIAKGAEAFVIGDCSYGLMQRAQSLGLTLVDAGHFPTENTVVPVVAGKISKALPGLDVSVSEKHSDCIHFV